MWVCTCACVMGKLRKAFNLYQNVTREISAEIVFIEKIKSGIDKKETPDSGNM